MSCADLFYTDSEDEEEYINMARQRFMLRDNSNPLDLPEAT